MIIEKLLVENPLSCLISKTVVQFDDIHCKVMLGAHESQMAELSGTRDI